MSVSVRAAIRSYLRPRSWEVRGDSRIYRLLGVRVYKKYVPTSGDLMSRWFGSPWLKPSDAPIRKRCERRLELTERYELRHIVGAISMQALTSYSVVVWSEGNYALLTVANVLINVYPIMLQRWTRIRLQRVLGRMETGWRSDG